ncbi:acyl-CoA N-acyltransferase [Mytilinidion resinicola]|uniref:Acyl-CoA N-acyltransferase n=1 Tax=Mytilinidion resinicola TaxID=574789 RepID=A0A6A6Y4Q2_9PEZI|nr:acyl-CoA N-acyltransferase [Mytilinidion resinicola]KAF2803498.1 acyl-CoA N-acyltransferase [Mytilinidion resinicola]
MPDPQNDSLLPSEPAQATFHFRPATLSDLPALVNLIDLSIRQLSVGHYTPSQIEGSIGFIFAPDTLLIDDGTYFIIYPSTQPEVIAAAGGWSFRKTLYGGDRAPGRLPARRDPATDRASIRAIFTHPEWSRRGLGSKMLRYCEEAARAGGFQRLEMGSTLTGVKLYEKCGYVRSGVEDVAKLGNGDSLRIVHLNKDL